MTEAEAKKFLRYATQIEHEVEKFRSNGAVRMQRATAPWPAAMDSEERTLLQEVRSKKWLRLESASCERFVRKIVKLVEDFEIE